MLGWQRQRFAVHFYSVAFLHVFLYLDCPVTASAIGSVYDCEHVNQSNTPSIECSLTRVRRHSLSEEDFPFAPDLNK